MSEVVEDWLVVALVDTPRLRVHTLRARYCHSSGLTHGQGWPTSRAKKKGKSIRNCLSNPHIETQQIASRF